MPGQVCHEHVDDLSHHLCSNSKVEFLHKAVEIGTAVKKGTQELGLQLADKSVITTNSPNLAKAVVAKLKSKQVQIKMVDAADDVGIETAAGSRRCAASQNKRISRGSARATRNHRLAKINTGAHALGITGTHRQQSYGHIAQGASNSQVKAMRRNLKAGTVLGNTRSCVTTTLAWFYGTANDPAVSIRVEQIAYWLNSWTKLSTSLQNRIKHMWRRLLPKMGLNKKNKWNHARGPVSATICTLFEAGWQPRSPNLWRNSDGSKEANIDEEQG